MTEVKHGDTIKVHYTGKLKDGKVFDSSRNREPLEFTVGDKTLIAGFENGVIGMKIGDLKTIVLACENAYGVRQPELVVEVLRTELPEKLKPEQGQRLTIHQPDGQTIPVMIVAVNETSVTLDANHPLAGEELTFEIELVEIF